MSFPEGREIVEAKASERKGRESLALPAASSTPASTSTSQPAASYSARLAATLLQKTRRGPLGSVGRQVASVFKTFPSAPSRTKGHQVQPAAEGRYNFISLFKDLFINAFQ